MGDHRLLSDFSTVELEQEVQRRVNSPPRQKSIIDFAAVLSYVQVAMKQIQAGQGIPKDFEHNLMEEVLVTIYGTDIWKWWSHNLRDQ